MKKEKVIAKLEKHLSEKRYVRLTRKKGDFDGISTGFVLAKSDDFILLQETDDFRILGFHIFPIDTIIHVRYNEVDKTYERILKEEKLLDSVRIKYTVDLTDWSSIATDLKNTGLSVVSECEDPEIQSFCIGPIEKVNKKSIAIKYFNALGIFDEKSIKNKFKNITKLSFDDHYANVFSKYVKEDID